MQEMSDRKLYRELLNRLKQDSKFLLTTHRGADPDGGGSELGLDCLLRELGKDVVILNQEEFSATLRFMDPEERIISCENKDLNSMRDRTIVFLDNSDLHRAGEIADLIREDNSNHIVIDHHDDTDSDFITYFRDSTVGATSEIVYELFVEANIRPPEHIAKALYTGIVADTGFFRYGKTRARTHEIAADLLRLGVDPAEISERLTKNAPVERLFLKRTLYNNVKINDEKTLAWFEVRRRDVEDLNLEFRDMGDIVNELLEPEAILVSVVFTEREPNLTRISVRSKNRVNVLPAVQQFGGGGHMNACGASVDTGLDQAVHDFIPILKTCIPDRYSEN